MFPAAKNMDPVVGVDIHIIQPPGPVPPLPIPHPFIGMLIDPFDFIPIVGATVMVNGVPRAIAGTAGKAIPPHIPIGGMFVKPPASECELFMGSATVAIDGDAAGYMALMCLSCHDIGMPPPPRVNPKKKSKVKSLVLPTSVVLPIPMGLPVLIGGPPTIFTMALGAKLAMAGLGRAFKRLRRSLKASKRWAALKARAKRAAERLYKRVKVGVTERIRNAVRKGLCTLTGHPVDVATGKVLTDAVDLELPGPLPFRLERTWYSTSAYDGPFGAGWHHSYDLALAVDASSSVAVVRLADGRYAAFALPTAEMPARNELENAWLRHEPNGHVFEDEAGLRHHFGHPPATERAAWLPLRRQEDAFGNAISFHYGPRGHLRGIVDSAGRRLPVSTDAHGRVTEIQGPHPNVANCEVTLLSYGYSYEGDLVEARDALGDPLRYSYDDQHRLVEETDRLGLTFYFGYEGSGIESRCVHTWGDGGLLERHLAYDVEAQTTTVTDSRGGVAVHEWNALGLVTRTVDPLGHETRFEYDDHAHLLAITDPLGGTTRFEYDALGRVVAETNEVGATKRVLYDDERTQTFIDEAGGAWVSRRDARGALLEEVDPIGHATAYEVNSRGLVVAATDALGRRLTVEWDVQGNPVHLAGPDGRSARFAFNALGQPIGEVDFDGRTVRIARDAIGRPVAVQEPSGEDTRITYGPDREPAAVLTRKGGSLLPSSAPLHLTYDTEGNVTAVEDAVGRRWTFGYNALNQLVDEQTFTGLRRRYAYDAAGRLTSLRDDAGRRTRLERDASGRTVRTVDADGHEAHFTYDALGRPSSAINASATVTWSYDACGRVTSESTNGVTVESQYDAVGNRIVRRVASDAPVRFDYAWGDQLSRVSVSGFPAEEGELAEPEDCIAFSRGEGIEERRLSSGLVASRRYEPTGECTAHRVRRGDEPPLLERRLCYNADRRLEAVQDSRAGTVEFAYDDTGRLARVRQPDGRDAMWPCDPAGNVSGTPLYPSPAMRASRFDGARNIVEIDGPGGPLSLRYDATGQLVRAERASGGGVGFTYDALGRRVSKTSPAGRVDYVWDGDRVACETDSAGDTTEYVFDGLAPLLLRRSGQTLFVEADHIGAPRLVTDPEGTVVWDGLVCGFGETEPALDDIGLSLRYPGQWSDSETGLRYNRHRYYAPTLGCYTQPDPLGAAGGPTPFNYVRDPNRHVDPLGLSELDYLLDVIINGESSLPPPPPYGPKDLIRYLETEGPASPKHAAPLAKPKPVQIDWDSLPKPSTTAIANVAKPLPKPPPSIRDRAGLTLTKAWLSPKTGPVFDVLSKYASGYMGGELGLRALILALIPALNNYDKGLRSRGINIAQRLNDFALEKYVKYTCLGKK